MASRQALADAAAYEPAQTPPPKSRNNGQNNTSSSTAGQDNEYHSGAIVSGPMGVTVIHPRIDLDDVPTEWIAAADASLVAPPSPASLPIRALGSGQNTASAEFHGRQLRHLSEEQKNRLLAELEEEEEAIRNSHVSGVIRAGVFGQTTRVPTFTPAQLAEMEPPVEFEYSSHPIRSKAPGATTAGVTDPRKM